MLIQKNVVAFRKEVLLKTKENTDLIKNVRWPIFSSTTSNMNFIAFLSQTEEIFFAFSIVQINKEKNGIEKILRRSRKI